MTDLTAKRLQLLKEIVPNARRVVTFYDRTNKGAIEAARLAREAAASLGMAVIERHVGSVDELQRGVQALKPGEADDRVWMTCSCGAVLARVVAFG